ncbi:MAG: hypothetical protein IKC72_07315, partial [Clostridia bacterium]|nr:hypothetical protein [Clostridia bacterium]
MKLDNIHGFHNTDDYVNYKLGKYAKAEKNFASLFELMFDESDNIMVEYSDGYRVKKITYGEYKERILRTIPAVSRLLCDLPRGGMVGLYLQNSVEWLRIFWAVLGAGYPLEYLCIASEGPEDPGSVGMNLEQFSELVASFEGVQNA